MYKEYNEPIMRGYSDDHEIVRFKDGKVVDSIFVGDSPDLYGESNKTKLNEVEKEARKYLNDAYEILQQKTKDLRKLKKGMDKAQKKLFDKVLNSEDELITIDGPDMDVVRKLIDEGKSWCYCLDDVEYGVQVYNQGTENNPEIYVSTYSSYDPSIDLKELADTIKTGEVLTEEKDIKLWIINNGYMDIEDFDEEDLEDIDEDDIY